MLQAPNYQGAVIDCLMQKVSAISPKCKKQVIRVAELQVQYYLSTVYPC